MKTKRYTAAQIYAILRYAEGGMSVFELCSAQGMSNASFYTWCAKYGGMDASLISQMKSVEEENQKLQKMFSRTQHAERVVEGETLGKGNEAISAPGYGREGSGTTKGRYCAGLPNGVIRSLDRITEWRGKPGTIRVNNGPAHISTKLVIWARKQGVVIQHLHPGQPRSNACIERYNRTVRHEWQDQCIIGTIEEARTSQHNGSGLTTMTDRTWASVASHSHRNCSRRGREASKWPHKLYDCTPLKMGKLPIGRDGPPPKGRAQH